MEVEELVEEEEKMLMTSHSGRTHTGASCGAGALLQTLNGPDCGR